MGHQITGADIVNQTTAIAAIARLTQIWNAHIPTRAKVIQHVPAGNPTHVRYLHPTKGWRRVSYKRLGLA